MRLKKQNDELVGKRFGKLTVLQYEMPIRAGLHGTYKCICDCGNISNVRKESLLSARTKSCGRCGRYEIEKGMRFGHLVAEEYVGVHNHLRSWKCFCDCGNSAIISEGELRRGVRKTCGCGTGCGHIVEGARNHGLSRTRLYRIWAGMKRRCFSPKCEKYPLYGERGITVCKEWMNFKPFYDWAYSNGYTDTLSIDRIDSNGNYEPSNCRWATSSEQVRNTRANKWFSYNGETHLLCDWARKVDVSPETIKRRFEQYGSPYGKGGESSA